MPAYLAGRTERQRTGPRGECVCVCVGRGAWAVDGTWVLSIKGPASPLARRRKCVLRGAAADPRRLQATTGSLNGDMSPDTLVHPRTLRKVQWLRARANLCT